MRKAVARTLIGISWVLCLAFLCVPTVELGLLPVGETGARSGAAVSGFVWVLFTAVAWPIMPELVPFTMVNILLCASPVLWIKAYGGVRRACGALFFVGAAIALTLCCSAVSSGYYLWTTALLVAGVGFMLSAPIWPGEIEVDVDNQLLTVDKESSGGRRYHSS